MQIKATDIQLTAHMQNCSSRTRRLRGSKRLLSGLAPFFSGLLPFVDFIRIEIILRNQIRFDADIRFHRFTLQIRIGSFRCNTAQLLDSLQMKIWINGLQCCETKTTYGKAESGNRRVHSKDVLTRTEHTNVTLIITIGLHSFKTLILIDQQREIQQFHNGKRKQQDPKQYHGGTLNDNIERLEIKKRQIMAQMKRNGQQSFPL